MRTRSLILGVSLLATGTIIGATTQHLASADVSSGERAVLIPTEPCRLADTRPDPNTVGPRSVPLGPRDTLTVKSDETGTGCSELIPDDATALSLNVTALGATELTFLTIWSDGDRPLAASLNPAPGQPPAPNAVVTQLSDDQEFRIYNEAGSVAVVIDVNGYYVGHDHDDRYYTEAEADDRFLTQPEADERYLLDGPNVVHLSTPDFLADGAEWGITDAIWTRTAGSQGCLIAGLDLPVGADVASVELRYGADAAPEVFVAVNSFTRDVFPSADELDFSVIHLLDADRELPATGAGEFDTIDLVTDPADVKPVLPIQPIGDADDTMLQVCSTDAITLLGATVTIQRP